MSENPTNGKGAALAAGRARLAKALSEGDFPLSFAQQRLWFLDQLDSGSSAYTFAARRRFLGPLDRAALARAFTHLVRRHESLRTTFPSENGEPVQRIADPGPVTLQIIQLEARPEETRAAALWRVVQAQVQRPFDLARGPLFRPVLIPLGPEEHELLVIVHLIVADAASLGILTRELATLYEADQAGRSASLPELPVQYVDFTLWQRQWLSGNLLERQLTYWRERLGGRPQQLELPTDHPRSRRVTAAGAFHTLILPPILTGRLQELSRRERSTLFMTLLAAFNALLARYSGQEEILVGTSIANRTHVELESVVGFFANTLVLRNSLAGDPTVRQVLARVRQTCLDAYAHSDLPFERLVEELLPERVLGQNPLFQVSLVMQNPALPAGFAFVNVASPFDLTLFVSEETDGTLRATFQYRRDLFAADTIVRLGGHFQTLLEGVAADPDRRLSLLPLLTDFETRQLLIEWNATTTQYPRDRSVHGLFEDQVDTTPDAVALVSGDESLTYRDLDWRANRLAHHLLAQGVSPGSLVGLWMARSTTMIVALLAVLKANCSFISLDSLATSERVAFMLDDAKVDAVLVGAELQPKLPSRVRAIYLDADGGPIAREPSTRVESRVGPDALAYVMYKSSATSMPNAVAVSHRSIVRLVRGTDYASFGPGEVFLQLAPATLDASVFEIWGALLNGGRLAIAPPHPLSAEELGAVLERYRVTTLCLAIGQLQQTVETRVELLRSLHQLVVVGDGLSPPHVRRVLNALPGLRLINGYGPVEGTVLTCSHTVRSAPPGQSAPIGRPIANTRVYVLDSLRRPVPIGIPGEIWIGGDGLARGYVGQPELTADRFVVHRFSPALEERLYRTGDLARWLRDGTLEFLGRLEDQVAIRGFRVGLRKIEAALALHPQVRESAVAVRPTPDGREHLVAYVAGQDLADFESVRQFLSRTLPEYMVPATVVMLERLPRTPDGNVDREALPDPIGSNWSAEALIEPRDDLERQLVAIWQEVLAIGHVGVRDSFFDLGGHSLVAARMLARLEDVLQLRLPLAILFQNPTIEGLAGAIRSGMWPAPGRSLVVIKPTGNRPPLFGVPPVNGIFFNYRNLARYLANDQPLYAFQSRGLDGLRKPLARIEDMAIAFLREIREVQPEGPYHIIGWCMGGVVGYEMAQQLLAAGEEVGLLALIATWPPMTALPDHQFRPKGRTIAFLESLLYRLRDYAQTLERLRGGEKMGYLQGRIKLLGEISAWRNLFRGARNDFYMGVVTQANELALSQYRPRSYPGRAVLFCEAMSAAREYERAWRELIAGGLDVFTVPCEDYRHLLDEPNVPLVAEYLTTCIERERMSSPPLRRG